MRIISDFHDYYDCGQKLDLDKQSLYIRKEQTEEHSWIFPDINVWRNYDPIFELLVVGFCGKLYPIFKLHAPYPFMYNISYCYRMEQIDSFIQTYYKKEVIDQYFASPEYKHAIRIRDRSDFEEFFKEWDLHVGEYEKRYAKTFEEKRCPIFVIDKKAIHYNRQLKPLDFVKIFDPMKAYQEINMFMSNLAVPIKPIPNINDVTMAEAKGFNKYSFRKDPSKKKKKS
jgi:hypothetical protein